MASPDEDDEQILPDSLQKLEIVPVAVATKTTCNNNPFYSIDSNIIAAATATAAAAAGAAGTTNCDRTEKLFGPMCNDCTTDHTESNSAVSPNRCTNRSGTGSNLQHTIHRPTSFKNKNKDKSQQNIEKNLQILREPILKSIGRSRHHKHEPPSVQINCTESNCSHENNERLLTNEIKTKLVSNTTLMTNAETVAGLWNESSTSRRTGKSNKKVSIDFKSLVTDCSHLTLSTSATMQSTNQKHRSKKPSTSLGDTDDDPSTSMSGNGGFDANTMNVSTSSNSSSTSSTCSQQARLHTSNCDVTIDELASYFETFVHIPKKMSTMAEMMYI